MRPSVQPAPASRLRKPATWMASNTLGMCSITSERHVGSQCRRASGAGSNPAAGSRHGAQLRKVFLVKQVAYIQLQVEVLVETVGSHQIVQDKTGKRHAIVNGSVRSGVRGRGDLRGVVQAITHQE